ARAAGHRALQRGAGRPRQHAGERRRRAGDRLRRGDHGVRAAAGRFPEGRGVAVDHGDRAPRPPRGALRRRFRGGTLISPAYLARRSWAQLRGEVLVLPSRTLALVWVAAVVLLPLVLPDPYVLRIAAMTCIFAAFAASWDLLAGYAGQVNFGHALFFGAGAYSSALLSLRLSFSPLFAVGTGALIATVVGFWVGYLCLRLRGSYLSLATLAFPLILIGVLFAFPDFSGGELGITGLQPIAASRVGKYYVAAVAMLVLVFGIWAFADSRFGLVLHAIRDDELAARASGIDTTRYQLPVFGIS